MKLLSIPVCILSLSAVSALADSKLRFSQLDFDAFISAPKSPAIVEILDKSGSDSKKSAVSDQTARASLSTKSPALIDLGPEKKEVYETGYSWTKPLDLTVRYLRPAITGVENDKDRTNSVKSSATWNQTQSVASSCDRAKAIKEVLNRYSGSDDFAAAQCTDSCANKGEKAALTSFEVKEVNGVSSSVVQSGSNSQYQIAAKTDIAAWPILEGASGYCSCLPTSCLK
jgi:hypothetical protein